ncbi:hypothetical protein, partial [Polynucleobacter sp. IMCC 30228]|uniref:hypothetical protein n=1 Tax=Polynucleobacter sp. IMCC 30228 TaxID=2781011 RepID=UPI001F3ED487
MRAIFFLIIAIFTTAQIIGCSEGSSSTSTTAMQTSVDPTIVAAEVGCMKQYAADPSNNYVNYAPAIGAPEHTDSIHSGVQPCATFTGSF